MTSTAPESALLTAGGADAQLVAAWSRPDLLSSLQVVVDAVVATVGFEVATVVARYGENTMRTVAGSGRSDALEAAHTHVVEVDWAEAVLAVAEQWGGLRFVPHGSRPTSDTLWTAPEVSESDDPDDWQPGDDLYLPFRDEQGLLVGFVAVDLPTNGRRPDERTRRQLESLALLAGRAMHGALAAERALDRSRVTAAARAVVRRASAQLGVAAVLDEALTAVMTEFDASGAWARLLERDSKLYMSAGWDFAEPIPDWLVGDMMASAARCWERQRLLEISARLPAIDLIGAEPYDFLVAGFPAAGLDSLLQVPLGAGDAFLGYVVLARPVGAAPWTPGEREEAFTLGHDLGRAVLNARTFDHERRLVAELQGLDTYKKQLVSSFSHELRTPLTSLGTHLELLEQDVGDWPAADAPLSAMRRAVGRLGRLVDDLLLLSSLADSNRALTTSAVDLCELVTTTLHVLDAEADGRSVDLQLGVPADPVVVSGDQVELARAVANVVGNALSYTPRGGEVRVSVQADAAEARVVVSDTGVGIPPEAHGRIFEDFYRGADPVTRARPGVGLGLGITDRILQRHGGRVEFDSSPGTGSTFVLIVPRRVD